MPLFRGAAVPRTTHIPFIPLRTGQGPLRLNDVFNHLTINNPTVDLDPLSMHVQHRK